MTPTTALDRPALDDDLRARAFGLDGSPPGPDRFGIEAELLPLELEDRRPVPIRSDDGPSTGAILEALADERGWRVALGESGAPELRTPGGGRIGFEPGGQLEYGSPPAPSIPALRERMEEVLPSLAETARRRGVALVARGVDPHNPGERVRRQLDSPRYRRLAAHLDRIGPAGRTMMLQTAAVHVNLDLGPRPLRRWRVANALSPYLVGVFANSARHAGRATGFRSFRCQQWRELDPARSGTFPAREPVAEYLDFALEAGAILLGVEGEPVRPYRRWLEEGAAAPESWSAHLTTLFPEVRPRGYLEFRSVDALPPRWLPAPLVFLGGILYDDEASRAAARLLDPAGEEALAAAGRTGVRDPEFRETALALWELALEGARRLGPVVGGRALETARAFRDRFTARGRDPADEVEPGEWG